MNKIIIFDMDGVIVDSEPLHAQHIHHFLTDLGVNNPQSFNKSLKGVSAPDTWKILVEEFNLEQDINHLVAQSRMSYMTFLETLTELPRIPGATDFIEYCYAKEYTMALASSASPKRIELFLNRLKLKKYFTTIISGDDIQHSKPAPDIFLLAAKYLNVEPKDCIVIEDAENGVRAAKAAGMKCIAYAGSDHNMDDLSAADMIVDDFHVLVEELRTGRIKI